jgi:hypothetical protein
LHKTAVFARIAPVAQLDSTCWTKLKEAVVDDKKRQAFTILYEPVLRTFLEARWKQPSLTANILPGIQAIFEESYRQGRALEQIDSEAQGELRVFLYKIARAVASKYESEASVTEQVDEDQMSLVFDRAWAVCMMRQAAKMQAERARGDDKAERRLQLLRVHFYGGVPLQTIAKLWQTEVDDLDSEYAVAEKEFESALEEVLVFHNPRTWAETEEESARVLALLG